MTSLNTNPSLERQLVVVRVPGTTANLGCGFDVLGLAVDIWNELKVERIQSHTEQNSKFQGEMIIEGEGAAELPRDERNLVWVGLKEAFALAGKPLPPLRCTCKNLIPFGRGLGSSSAAIVSGIIAGLVLAGHDLPVKGSEELLQLATKIEGHPDNVAPAIYGGCQIGLKTTTEPIRYYTSRVRMEGLQNIVFVPDMVSETEAARGLLPDKIPMKDAIFNMSRIAFLINSLANGKTEALAMAFEDRLHQDARSVINPHLKPVIKAAIEAGALGAFMSGAGPSVMALLPASKGDIYSQRKGEIRHSEVATAMKEAAAKQNVKGRVFITRPTYFGAHVVRAEPNIFNGKVTTPGFFRASHGAFEEFESS